MPSTIAFTNLLPGQEVDLPYEVTGTIDVNPNTIKVVAAARQIDDALLQDIGGSLTPGTGTAGDQTFSTEITALDCPLADTYYMLTIYCWDDITAGVSVGSVTFKTSSASGAVPVNRNGISRR